MITLWDWTTYIILVFHIYNSNYNDSVLDIVYPTSILHPPGRTKLVIIFIQVFHLSTLVISSLTSPGYCDNDPTILVFTIHNFRRFAIWIFSIFMGDYVIHDSGILDIDVHCESGYRGIQINAFMLYLLISSTLNYNSVHITKFLWWWDVDNFNKDAVSIDCIFRWQYFW